MTRPNKIDPCPIHRDPKPTTDLEKALMRERERKKKRKQKGKSNDQIDENCTDGGSGDTAGNERISESGATESESA